MPWFSVAVTTLENNVKGTLKIQQQQGQDMNNKEDILHGFMLLYILWSARHRFKDCAPACPAFSARPAAPGPCPSRCGSPPAPGRQIWKTCGKVHLRSSCLCPASTSAPTEVKPSGWSAVNKLSEQLNAFSCLWIYKRIPISSKSDMK